MENNAGSPADAGRKDCPEEQDCRKAYAGTAPEYAKEATAAIVMNSCRYAPVGLRAVAILLDWIIFLALARLLFFVFPVTLPAGMFNTAPGEFTLNAARAVFGRFSLLALVYTVCYVCYKVLLVGKYGATLGKMALGVRVVKPDGTPVTYGTALVREFLVKNLFYGLIFFISWLGYAWAIWDNKKQTWHDKIAKTIVIKT